MKTKKKAFTLVELIVVIAIIGIIAAIITPFFLPQSSDPTIKLILLLSLIAIIIIAFATNFIIKNKTEPPKIILSIILSIIGLSILTCIGISKLKPNTTTGNVSEFFWEYTIQIQEKRTSRDSDGKTHTSWHNSRTIVTQGFDKNPYWGKYELHTRERVGSKRQSYSVFLEEENSKYTEFHCDKALWDKLYPNQKISIKYRNLQNFIVELLE